MWDTEDHTLIQRIAAHDHQAFKHLYQRYARRLIGYRTRLLSQRELAEEVLNEVMLALWQQAPQFDARGPLIAWLFGIARRKALQTLRNARPRPIPPLVAPERSAEDILETSLVRQEFGRAVERALADLPIPEREVVELTYYHDLSYAEIAAVVGCPVNTVKTRMARARQRLAARLGALGLAPVSAPARRTTHAPVSPIDYDEDAAHQTFLFLVPTVS
jgi:RNA polymerase sigma-70 factor (ECF subfamily)